MSKSDIGVYGLGVMGHNLALNLEGRGFRVSVFNRMEAGEQHLVDDFLQETGPDKQVTGARTPEEFVRSLKAPRKILIMVKAGPPVDAVIDGLLPHLEPGDILIDGGNSHYADTERRSKKLSEAGIDFVGMGVSGGEEGARHGPSLMPGGTESAWQLLEPMLTAIAAQAPDGTPCCTRIGPGGAGHFVKMIHNGIEYADMQLIAEAYHFMDAALGMNHNEIGKTFRQWNEGALASYLMEITGRIFNVTDKDGSPLLNNILDSAGQKGTGKWTAIAALQQGVPLPLISQAVFSRFTSSLKSMRGETSGRLPGPTGVFSGQRRNALEDLKEGVLASRIIALAEGFLLIRHAAREYNWNIDLSAVARIWRAGCIIRSSLLEPVAEAFSSQKGLEHLLLAEAFQNRIERLQSGWRESVCRAAKTGIPLPGMSAALSDYDQLRSARLPANLIQAQRDYFGAHTYERTDEPRGTFFHTEWETES